MNQVMQTKYQLTVVVRVKGWHFLLETLANTNRFDRLVNLRLGVGTVTVHKLPVIKHTLRERLTTRCLAKRCVEPERFDDWQVCLDL